MIVDLTVPADPRLVEADTFTGFHGVAARSATFATLASGFTIDAEHLWVPVTATCTTRFSDVQELVAGTAGRALLEPGDMSKGVFWAGMVQGPIHDTPSCAELIGRIVADAEAIVRDRLGSMLAGSGALVKSD